MPKGAIRLSIEWVNVSPGGEGSPTFVVCGNNPLVHQLARQLINRFPGGSVTVVLPNRRGSYVPQLERLERVRILCAERLDLATLRAAGVADARALALVDQADVENFHAALRAHELNPHIRLVLRMFNTGLGFRIRRLFADCVVVSMSQFAAPSFIAAALGEDAQDYVRLGERTLYVSSAREAPPDQVVTGLVPGPDGIELRSAKSPVNRVLALAVREPYSPGARRRWLTMTRFMVRHSLIRLLLMLLTLIAVGCCLMALFAHNSWGGAVYETLLDAAGAAQSEPQSEPLFKILQLSVVFIGLAMTPLVTALVVGGVVRGQLPDSGIDPARMENHVVVAGLGNVGMRVMEQLSDLGVPVVALDYDENARGMKLARSLGVPTVVGQATWDDTLRAVGAPKARALVLLTSSDAVNLEAAMLGQSYRDDLRVVLRLSDDDLAERVQRTLETAVVRSVFQLAAAGFAAVAVERGVIATLSINQATLLIAELPVEEGSALAGVRISEAGLSEHTRVLALQRAGSDEPQWKPSAQEVLEVGQQLVVVATRTGLDDLLARSSGTHLGPADAGREPNTPGRELAGAGHEQDAAGGEQDVARRGQADPGRGQDVARCEQAGTGRGQDVGMCEPDDVGGEQDVPGRGLDGAGGEQDVSGREQDVARRGQDVAGREQAGAERERAVDICEPDDAGHEQDVAGRGLDRAGRELGDARRGQAGDGCEPAGAGHGQDVAGREDDVARCAADDAGREQDVAGRGQGGTGREWADVRGEPDMAGRGPHPAGRGSDGAGPDTAGTVGAEPAGQGSGRGATRRDPSGVRHRGSRDLPGRRSHGNSSCPEGSAEPDAIDS